MRDETRGGASWTFLTNHLHVLACVCRDPELRIRDIAALVGITERATAQILGQLEASGYLTKTRLGRRNRYTVHDQLPLRHPLHDRRPVAELLRVLTAEPPPTPSEVADGSRPGGRGEARGSRKKRAPDPPAAPPRGARPPPAR